MGKSERLILEPLAANQDEATVLFHQHPSASGSSDIKQRSFLVLALYLCYEFIEVGPSGPGTCVPFRKGTQKVCDVHLAFHLLHLVRYPVCFLLPVVV